MRFQTSFQSIRSIVTSIIIVLGLLSMAATLITGQVYHSLTLRSQLENIERQLRLETTQNLQRLRQYSLQFSTLIINSSEFRNAVSRKGSKYLHAYLSELQTSPFLQSGVLNVSYVNIYADNGELQAGIKFQGKQIEKSAVSICGKIMSISKPTSYALATDVIYALCTNEKSPYLSARVPFKIDEHSGYLELVSNITGNLSRLDQIMAFPVRLRLKNQSIIFISDSWPEKASLNSLASYPVKNDFGEIVFYIDALHLDANLEEALSFAQMLVISGAFSIIICAVMLSLYILKKTVISPVNEVVHSLRKVRENKENLGAQVHSRGADEIMELMDDFNAMSSALNQLYSTLEKMTYTDSLTRLGNRKLFHEKINQVSQDACARNKMFALLLIDLDKFKQVNDTYGHMVGDKLLIETSNRFGQVIRSCNFISNTRLDVISTPIQDYLTRLGGDEFAIILPEISGENDAITLAKKLADTLAEPMIIDGQEIDFGLSTGIALYPTHADNIDQLVHCSDVAMYESKKTNNNYVVYSSEMDNNS